MKADGSTEHKHFITTGKQLVAVVKQTGGVTTVRYFHQDHLGSTTAITDAAGAVVERLAYEPFGKRRFPAGGGDANNTVVGVNTDRGFTGHEHLDELGLIHMNGRVYDPLVGRFMSADPNVPEPLDPQSYNRYAYVQNNPLSFKDPSGFDRWGDQPLGYIPSQSDYGYSPSPYIPIYNFANGSWSTPSSNIIVRINPDIDLSSVRINSDMAVTQINGQSGISSNSANSETSIVKQVGSSIKNFVDGGYGGLAGQAQANGEYAKAAGYVGLGTLYGVMNTLTLGKGGAVANTLKGLATRGAATAESLAANSGLRTSAAISAERAETFLVKNGMSADRAADFVASFDGPVTARLVRPGENFLRYTDAANSTGSFVTKTPFANPAAAIDGLYLAPYGNGASLMQSVTSTGRSIMLEGGVANGGAGVRQSVIVNRGAFQFGTGVRY